MPGKASAGRPVPVLLIALLASFVLMILSGILFGLGMPDDWARALFVGTVLLWAVLGLALILQDRREVRVHAEGGAAPSPGPAGDDDGDG